MILNINDIHIDDFIQAKDYCMSHHDNYSRYTECGKCPHKGKCMLYQYAPSEQTAIVLRDFIDEVVEPFIQRLYQLKTRRIV